MFHQISTVWKSPAGFLCIRQGDGNDRPACHVTSLYPALLQADLTDREKENAIASCAEGYAFPTSLDRDPPVSGLAPKSQAQFFKEALKETQAVDMFAHTLNDLRFPTTRLVSRAVNPAFCACLYKITSIKFTERMLQFFACIHHDWPMPRYRFA